MLSIPHMIVVFVIVLVVFGPQKLPELARGLGKLMAEFRKASTDFKSAFEEEMRDLERQAREVERRKAEAASAGASAAAQTQPATFATPSGVETKPSTEELAASGATEASVPEVGAAEGPVVAPVSEGNVAREPDAERSDTAQVTGTTQVDTGTGSGATQPEQLQTHVQKADTGNAD